MPAVKAEYWMPMRGMELDPTINTVEGIRKLADYLLERYGKQL
jgi:hypothetical protein